jgi:soluble lytic murein transglycosylase-like protein
MKALKRAMKALKVFMVKLTHYCIALGGLGCAGYLAVVHLPDSNLMQDLLAQAGFEKTQAIEAPDAPPVHIRVYTREEMERLVFDVAERKNIHPLVLFAQVGIESGWNQFAIGDNGRSYGLMQIQPKIWKKFCKLERDSDLLDAEKNLECGADIFAMHYEESQGRHSEKVWMAYRKHNGSGPAARNYANKVMARLNGLLIESTDMTRG